MSKFNDYLRLMRISLLPTAWSNVLMGAAMIGDVGQWPLILLLLLCSSCLYIAGMVLNDVYDVEIDRKERPERVLPSGKIPVSHAKAFGYSLLAAALAIGLFLSLDFSGKGGDSFRLNAPTFAVVVGLIILILLYNRTAKHSRYGPIVMGLCRSGNVVLGGSLTRDLLDLPISGGLLFVALSVGLFVAGITWFAKHENDAGIKSTLFLGAGCMAAAIGALFWFPFTSMFQFSFLAVHGATPNQSPLLFCGLLAMMIFPVVRKVILATVTASPSDIKQAVIGSLLTIIMIDASICYLVSPGNPAYALVVASLIVPAFLMTRRIMAT